jgi:hypothetical protein
MRPRAPIVPDRPVELDASLHSIAGGAIAFALRGLAAGACRVYNCFKRKKVKKQ